MIGCPIGFSSSSIDFQFSVGMKLGPSRLGVDTGGWWMWHLSHTHFCFCSSNPTKFYLYTADLTHILIYIYIWFNSYFNISVRSRFKFSRVGSDISTLWKHGWTHINMTWVLVPVLVTQIFDCISKIHILF